jgi:putative oxidoreductase
LLILRLAAGGLLLGSHGLGKLSNMGERAAAFANPIGLGPVVSFWLVVFAEVFCTTMVMLGLLTRVFTVPIIIFFMVAFFIQHAHDPWPRRELPLLFGFSFLALLFTGPGRLSIDGVFGLRWPWGRAGR